MKSLLVSIMLLFSGLYVNAQQVSFKWAKNITESNLPCYVNSDYKAIQVDQDKNLYVVGTYINSITIENGVNPVTLSSGNNCNGYIVKYDSLGNYLWSKNIGGGDQDEALGLAIDNQDNVYVTGRFASTVDFDSGTGTDVFSASTIDIYITKFDENGNYIWTKTMGGNWLDLAFNVTVDLIGNVYLTGYFNTTVDFDPGLGVANLTSNGNGDIFVCKLDQNGIYVWAKAMGGASSSIVDQGYDLVIDPLGNVYVSGWFRGTADFDPDPINVMNLVSDGSSDAFVCKLDMSGNLVWAKNFGGNADDCATSITQDLQGNIYTSGYFYGIADFDPSANTFNLDAGNSWDIYVNKMDTSGNLIWAKSFGGADTDKSFGMEMDKQGNIYTTGYFKDTVDFNPDLAVDSVYRLVSAGNYDAFISKLDSAGNFIWAKRIGSTQDDYGYSIAVDDDYNLYGTGTYIDSADLNPDEIDVFNISSANYGIYAFKWSYSDDISVGISNEIAENTIVYPNPTKGTIHLSGLDETKVSKLLVFDHVGRLVTSFDSVNEIDLSRFSPGMYQLQVLANSSSRSFKIQVIR
ncbi:MAG: T9SS type A sorting domain-containing protein [Bacteroidota bacterium]